MSAPAFLSPVVAESLARKMRHRSDSDARVREAHDDGDCFDRCPLCRDEHDDDVDEFAPIHARDAAVAHAIATSCEAAALAAAIAADTGRTAA